MIPLKLACIVVLGNCILWSQSGLTKPSYGADAKQVKTKKEAPSKRKPATGKGHACEVTYHTDKGTKSTDMTLTDSTKFPGSEPHEEITVSVEDGQRTLLINTYFKNPTEIFTLDTMTCDDLMNCTASRTTFTAQGPKVRVMSISPSGGGNVRAIMGDRTLFAYGRNSQGFVFDVIKDIKKNGYKGTQIRCVL